jgi:hypothetical protein
VTMIIPLAALKSTFLASQPMPETGFLHLSLLLLLFGGILLFGMALFLSILRNARRSIARRRDRLAIPPRPAGTVDAWAESSARLPLDPQAPREVDPEQDLPPMGGRFK